MSEQNNIDPHVCNTGVPEATLEVSPTPDIRPGYTDDAPLKTGETGEPSKRRASFAAPVPATDKKPGSGGLDSLGKGYLP